MAAGGSDGSLRFDTRINTDGFEKGISTLTAAVSHLSDVIEKLSQNIVQRFGGVGTAAVSASKDVESIGEAAQKSEDQVKSLQEQMDAIEFNAYETGGDRAQEPEAVREVDITDPSKYGYAPSVTSFIDDYVKGVQSAKEYTNEFKQLITELQGQLSDMENQGMYFGDEEYDNAYLKLAKVKQALADYKQELLSPTPDAKVSEPIENEASKVEMACANMKKYVANAFSSMLGHVKRFGKELGSKLASKAKQAVSNLKGLGKTSNGVSKSILKLSNMFKLMLIRMAMRAAIQGVKEGMQNLVQYSDSANQSMSGLMTNMTYLKNSFAAAFAPILSFVAPVLNTLINLLGTAIGYINQFFAALGGGSTFVRAKKVNQDYAKSLGATGGAAKQAGKDAKKALAPFDDLVQIQQQGADTSGAGGGGGGAGAADMFETVAIDQGISDFANKLKDMFAAGDWEGIGKFLGEKINEAVSRFTEFISWDNVGAQITAFVTAFTTLFNSLVATIDWYAIGIMMGTGINTIVNTLYLLFTQIEWFMLGNALSQGVMGLVNIVNWELFGATIGAFFQAKISGLLGFILGVDWGTIGTALSDCIVGIANKIEWEQLGYLFAAGLNAIFDTTLQFAKDFPWVEMGEHIATSISTFFQTFRWADAGEALSTFVIGILDFLITVVQETDWASFVQGIVDCIEAVDWIGIAGRIYELFWSALGIAFGALANFVGTLIADGVSNAKNYFQTQIDGCGGDVALGILNGILKAWAGIGEWIDNHIFLPFINGFKAAFGIHSPSTKMAEMGQYLWDGFCNGVKEFFANPVSFIKQHITDPFVNGIKNLLGIHSPSTVLEEVGGYTVDGFNSGVEKGQSSSQSIIQSWAQGVSNWFAQKLGISSGDSAEAQGWANSTMSGFNNAVNNNYKNSQGSMETWANNVRKWFVASGTAKGVNPESWKKFASDIIKAFASEITSKHVDTQSPVEVWAENIRKWFVGVDESQGVNELTWTKFANSIIQAFKTKIEGCHTETQAPMMAWAKNVKEWFWGDADPNGTGGLYGAFYDMAKRINEGFAKGISDFAYMAKDAIRQWASDAMAEAKAEFDINSPSKEFHTIAEYVVRGFNNGISDMARTSVNAVQNWLDGVVGVFDGVSVQLPIGVNIPNAASYLPRMARGIVVPSRAGEMSAEMRNYAGYRDQDTLSYLVSKMDELISRVQSDGDRPIQLVLNMTGNLASLARVLKPELDKEAARRGVSLVVVGGI